MVIVESHHHVLLAWAQYRNRLECAPRLLTLDHHTDTSAPFRSYLRAQGVKDTVSMNYQRQRWLKAINYREPSTIADAIERLDHDEHIVTALETDIIESAFVIAHNATDTDLKIYKDHKIMCVSVEAGDRSSVSREACDLVLESAFLSQKIDQFNQQLFAANEAPLLSRPYILDIDLDYLNTFKSVHPGATDYLKMLAQQAGLITVATEPNHVELCAIDKDLRSVYLLEHLQKLLKL